MFNQITASWRLPSIFTPIKGNSYNKQNKLILFEQAIDYILTSTATPDELLGEIIGFHSTKCEAFKKLSIDNSFFFADAITKETTYLIAICFLKNIYLETNQLLQNIDNKKINTWINSKFKCKNIRLSCSYLDNVKLGLNEIIFCEDNYRKFPPLKLTKLLVGYDLVSYNTSRVKNLKMTEIFHNHIYNELGKCLGAVKYFLEEMAIAYSLDKHKRNISKNNYVKSLEIVNFKLISNIAEQKIDMYQKDSFGYQFLFHIFDIYTIISEFHISVVDIIDKMNLNNLSQVYVQILTNSHALGLVIILKGNNLKILFYNPNNLELYYRFYLNITTINATALQNICSKFEYLMLQNINKNLLLKIYVPTTNNQTQIIAESSNPVSKNKELSNIKELLILIIINHDLKLMTKLLETSSLELDFIFQENGKTPLTLAICYQDVNMVLGILKHGINTEMTDGYNKSALDYAIEHFDIKLMKLLFEYGATKNINFNSDHTLTTIFK